MQLDLEIHGLLAAVRRGRLTGIQAGTCDITGTLKIADTQVARRKKSLDLPLAIRLKQGIPLLDDAARPQPPREAHSETP
jgi:hypothetical protein